MTQRKDFGSGLAIEQAATPLTVPGAAAPLAPQSENNSAQSAGPFNSPFVSITPAKLFDNLFFVGTTTVGAFVIETGDGLCMIDTGCGDVDAALMVSDMKKLKLNPFDIKLILISHEHFDHYGGLQYLKKNICPEAKVAMSLIGWNLLQTVPEEWAYIGPRPQSLDIYLVDGMKIKIGHQVFQMVATPGHSPGCMSFIFPVIDNREPHMAGMMGGTAVWPTQIETRLYKTSIEYFKAFTDIAGCDVGLSAHWKEADYAAVLERKPGTINPLILEKVKFEAVYLQKYRNLYQAMVDSGKMVGRPY